MWVTSIDWLSECVYVCVPVRVCVCECGRREWETLTNVWILLRTVINPIQFHSFCPHRFPFVAPEKEKIFFLPLRAILFTLNFIRYISLVLADTHSVTSNFVYSICPLEYECVRVESFYVHKSRFSIDRLDWLDFSEISDGRYRIVVECFSSIHHTHTHTTHPLTYSPHTMPWYVQLLQRESKQSTSSSSWVYYILFIEQMKISCITTSPPPPLRAKKK